jgi:hypothetical protein
MRKLASVQRILRIEPIAGADMIEVCTVLGWQCVISKRDGFKVGDLVVYIEVDSIVPPSTEFEFLRESKFRIKIAKRRGQISEGLVMPMDILSAHKNLWREGDDVTELLGITKYESQSDIEQNATFTVVSKNPFIKFMRRFAWFRKYFGEKKLDGNFPTFISKTDEDRIQIHPEWLEQYADLPFQVTEKLDGQSATYALVKKGKQYDFIVCSRTQRRFLDGSNWWKIVRQTKIESLLHELIGSNEWVAIQGEIVGAGIQGNKYGLSGIKLFAFQIVVPSGRISPHSIEAILNRFGVECVPMVSWSFRLPDSVSTMVDIAKGMKSLLNKTKLREGIVLRNYENKVSFKVINPEFLLKSES